MGFIKKAAKVFKPVCQDDPFFGRLLFQKVGFWEGKKFFTPENREYEFTIEGGEDRPTESQRRFFCDLETRYAKLKPEITKALLEQLHNWNERFSEKEIWRVFVLESFSIPDLDAGQHEWELVYEFKKDGHLFCLMMNGWKIEGLRIDG